MRLSDEVLMAYADGELDGELRAEVRHAIETDPDIARRVAQHAAARRSIRDAFAAVLDEPVPERLIAATRGASATVRPSPVRLVPRPRRLQLPSWPQWAAMAASLLLGAGLWQLIGRGEGPLFTERAGTLAATGALARALSGQLAANQSAQAPVQIGISFRSRNGSYCRTFTVRSDSYAGMACRDVAGWQVQMLGRAPRVEASGYRQAASGLPPWLAQQVDSSIAGEPLDAPGEAQARARDWR